jgi:cytochrome c556
MTSIKAYRAALIVLALLVGGASGVAVAQNAATPAQAIENRQGQLRRLGAAFKAINDQSRASAPNLADIRANAQTISALASEFPTWFPSGSGPAAGLDTRAKPEIWSDSAGFSDQVRQFQTEAQALAAASTGEDIGAIAAQTRAVGQSCASCHARFREHT